MNHQKGDRVRLISTTDPYTDLRPGDEGTVQGVNALGIVSVQWDSGSSLSLIHDEDRWEVT